MLTTRSFWVSLIYIAFSLATSTATQVQNEGRSTLEDVKKITFRVNGWSLSIGSDGGGMVVFGSDPSVAAIPLNTFGMSDVLDRIHENLNELWRGSDDAVVFIDRFQNVSETRYMQNLSALELIFVEAFRASQSYRPLAFQQTVKRRAVFESEAWMHFTSEILASPRPTPLPLSENAFEIQDVKVKSSIKEVNTGELEKSNLISRAATHEVADVASKPIEADSSVGSFGPVIILFGIFAVITGLVVLFLKAKKG